MIKGHRPDYINVIKKNDYKMLSIYRSICIVYLGNVTYLTWLLACCLFLLELEEIQCMQRSILRTTQKYFW